MDTRANPQAPKGQFPKNFAGLMAGAFIIRNMGNEVLIMGEFESNMKYARSVGADIRKPTRDTRTTSQRITDERREMKQKLKDLESDLLVLVARLYGEDEITFSAETKEVMERWKPVFAKKYFKI